MKVECPFCKEQYNIKRSQLGKRATCSMCEQSFVLYVEGVEPRKPIKIKPKVVILILVAILLLGAAGGAAYWIVEKDGWTTIKELATKIPGLKKVFNKEEKKSSDDKENSSGNVKSISKAEMTSSQSNLKQIYVILSTYADDFSYKFPQSLNILMENKLLTDPKILIAPFDKVSTPAEGKITPANTTYAYVCAGTKQGEPAIIAFEKPWLLPEGSDQINILFANGQVQTETIKDVSKMTCRQVVEVLTKDYQNKELAEKLLKNADAEDQAR